MTIDTKNIEVIGLNLMCFRIHPKTLEPIGSSYYEPAAWTDPRGPQMTLYEWSCRRAALAKAKGE